QIVHDVNSAAAFSPDGKRILYLRLLQEKGRDQVLLANADGAGEQVVLERPRVEGQGLVTNPSWSASANLIAIGGFDTRKDQITSILVFTPQGKLIKSFPQNRLVTSSRKRIFAASLAGR